ncbi:MAG: polynucleotide adenylyltransferase [Verrucomicrobiae bacterium]|nr:polynucleotide adenylyltransferase [Verrucomicrobiae bacterium]
MSISRFIPKELLEIVRNCFDPRGIPAYLVGGAVRDALLGMKGLDYDTEVYGISLEKLSEILLPFGKVCMVGKSFGVVKLKTQSGCYYDFSLPRRDSKLAPGHRGFQIEHDPYLDPRDAASRRDFTINAMMYSFKDQKILDFFNGQNDLENRVLRHTSPAFTEDPLRVLRGMHFASRFNLTAAPETITLCKSILSSYRELSLERIYNEWLKWATLSVTPSLGILFLEQTQWIEHTPELAKLRDCPQDPIWHSEGDVLTHTLLACDQLVRQPEWNKIDSSTRAILLFAALCHDFGKPDTLVFEHEEGVRRVRAKGHATAGISHIEVFLSRIGIPETLRKRILLLTENHMFGVDALELSEKSLRRLAHRLHPERIENLLKLWTADRAGRHSLSTHKKKKLGVGESVLRMRKMAEDLQITQGAPSPILKGKMIIQETGLHPGPRIGKIQSIAYEAQLDGEFHDEESALRWLKNHIDENIKSDE